MKTIVVKLLNKLLRRSGVYALIRWMLRRRLQLLLEMQVRKALRLSKLENRRYIVTTFFGRPGCYTKQMLKEAIKRRKFRKGVTIAHIEKSAYFVTK